MTSAAHTPDPPSPDRLEAPEGASPRIWAVGGGKGGVGKSVVTSNLAAALAGGERRCAVIDLDLGGANLHTLLGVSRPRYSLSHLFTRDVDSLADLLVQTSVPNLWLVSGNQALLDMADPRRGRKELLMREVRELDVDDVVLDLGAGSAQSVVDFFLLARRGLVVTTPEPTAVENAEHFLRTAFHRSLRPATRLPEVDAAIRRLRDDGSARRVRSARELIALVRATDPAAAKPLEERASTFAPLLVLNQVHNGEQRRVGAQLVEACRERLGVALELAGQLDADPNVAAAVSLRQPVLQAFPTCRFARQIESLAAQLERGDGPRDLAARRDASRLRQRCDGPLLAAAPPPKPAFPPLDPAAPGTTLRLCREALGLSLAELTERTRIRCLEDIENERFERLPPEVYLKGNLLEYARELGLPDIAALVNAYLARGRERERPAPTPAPDAPGPPPPAPRRRARRWRRR